MRIQVASTFFRRCFGLIPKQMVFVTQHFSQLITQHLSRGSGQCPLCLTAHHLLRPDLHQSARPTPHHLPRSTVRQSAQPHVLFFPRCRSLHTIGMFCRVDLAFIDAQNRVIKSCREVPPLRIISCPGASSALERFSQDSPWLEKGEFVQLSEAKSSKALATMTFERNKKG